MNEEAGVGEVTHLLYADDTILFCDASVQHVRGVLAALIVFQPITGLKVNLSKCSISVVGEVPNARTLADILGCAVESFPCSYLGLPLGSRAVGNTLWDPVVTKVQNRLETWKAKHLSFGGRMVLIKSVLSSLPVYFLPIFRAPATVVKTIERIQNHFLWTGISEVSKMHWVSWDTVKTPMKRGGLGIADLEGLNKALLGKWLWRFGVEREAWWRILIEEKYGLERGSEWRSTCFGISFGWSVWVWICKMSAEFWEGAYVDPGGGDWVTFWHDFWVPGKHLARDFPRVATAAQPTDAFITDICAINDRRQWEIGLNVSLRGGALEEFNRLKELLQNLPPDTISSGPPRLRWRHDDRNGFSVRSFKSRLFDSKFPGMDDYPATTVWVPTVPTKVCCFVWMASSNSIATVDNLRRRGCIFPNRCVLCCAAEESVSHLLLHCNFSSLVWSWLCRVWGDFAPLQRDVLHVLKGWKEGNCVASFGRFRKVLCHSIWWFIWLERNDRIFRDKSCSVTQLVWKIVFNTSRWLLAHKAVSSSDCSEWLNMIFHPP
ncbi:Putative ribonuclease H protein At1g65750 [Linum grandiflorum]